MKRIVLSLLWTLCIFGIGFCTMDIPANATNVSVYVDCGDGSCHTTNAYDIIRGEDVAKIGSTVASVFDFDEDPTAIDQDFTGWYVYNKTTGAQIPGTGLLTTAQVRNYVIPSHNIEFVAQWTPRAGYPVTNVTYASFLNGTGEPCYDVKITLVHEGVRYSGYGFVSIPESIYSTWTSNIEVIWEPMNGYYILGNGKWTSEPFTYTNTLRSFKKEKSLYITAKDTNKGREILSPRRKVNDWYYKASFVAPEISVLQTANADRFIEDTSVVPANYTVEAEIFRSGSTYDSALQAATSAYGTSNVVVVDIELKDTNGVNVTQLSDFVDVRIDIPSDYVLQPRNTVIVYYLSENGTLEKCDTTFYGDDPSNRYVTFKTNHFSTYVIAESEPLPETTVAETEAIPEETAAVTEIQTTVPVTVETVQTTEESRVPETTVASSETQSDSPALYAGIAVALAAVGTIVVCIALRKKRK